MLLCAGVVLAADYRGKVKKVDADKGSITVTIDGKDMLFPCEKDTKVTAATGKELPDGLRSKELAVGADVVITTEKKDGKEHVTKITLAPSREK
jgi:hypothetical protein